MNKIVLETQQLQKTYCEGEASLVILNEVNFSVKAGEKIAIIGASGSGKSTFLHLISGLDQPTSGRVLIDGHNLANVSQQRLGQLRNRYLGFVYQFHHLLAEFSALDNVAMPLMIRRESAYVAYKEARIMLERVGLGERLQHKPSQLSGGERQRVAIARALVTRPAAILADEPTGNLDDTTAYAIFDLMLEINAEVGTALVMVTHDRELAAKMDACFQIRDKTLHPVLS